MEEIVALYGFTLKDRGNQPHCRAFRLAGRNPELKGVEVTVEIGVYPKEGATYHCSIVDSDLKSLFRPGSMVALVRRMNDIDLEVD